MALDTQALLTLAIVAAAVAYLARSAWRTVGARRAGACGGCRSCGARQEPAVFELNGQRAGDRASAQSESNGRGLG